MKFMFWKKPKVKIEPTGIESKIIYTPFHEGKEALENKGYHVISLEEDAKLRIEEGENSDFSREGNWTREGVLYIPYKGAYLTKNSPIMQNPFEAVRAQKGRYGDYFLSDEQIEQALKDSVLFDEGPSKNPTGYGRCIPTDRFSEEKITTFAFGDTAELYGQFLKEMGIDHIFTEIPLKYVYPTNYIQEYETPDGKISFARQLWFESINVPKGGSYSSSNLGGRSEFGDNDKLIGVKNNKLSQSTK